MAAQINTYKFCTQGSGDREIEQLAQGHITKKKKKKDIVKICAWEV